MKGLRYLTLLPLLLFVVSIAVGIDNYQDTKEEMRRDLTHALRQFVMDKPQQQLLLDTLSTLHSAQVLTLNDMEDRFRTGLSIQPLKDTSHVAVCLMRDDDGDLFCERAQVCSDTLLWTASQSEHDNAIIALKAFANPSVCSIFAHWAQSGNGRMPAFYTSGTTSHPDAGAVDGTLCHRPRPHPQQGSHLRCPLAQERQSGKHPLYVYLSPEKDAQRPDQLGHRQQKGQGIPTHRNIAIN